MSHQHSSAEGTRVPSTKKDGIQWQLQDESPGAVSFSGPGGGGVGGNLEKVTRRGERENTPPLPPLPPPACTDPDIRAWLEETGVSCINQLMRNYPAEILWDAIEDYERATDQKRHLDRFIPRDRTAYFRSLLR